MQRLLPLLDNDLATKDELVALKELTFRNTVVSMDSMLPPPTTADKGRDDGGAKIDAPHIDDSAEISINMPDQRSGGIRRVVKSASATTTTAHLGIAAGLAGLSEKVAERLDRYNDKENKQHDKKRRVIRNVKFNMKELMASIRPQSDTDDGVILNGRDDMRNSQSSSILRISRTFCSHHSLDGGITDDNSPSMPFPFSLPPLLAEAGDDVWDTTTTQIDLIVPSDTIVWDLTPDNDNDGIEGDGIGSEGTGCLSHDDDIRIPSLRKEQKLGSEQDGERKTIFSGFWEQTYRQNVAGMKEDTSAEPMGSSPAIQEQLDFNAAEKNSQYDGPSDYGSLFVASDLDVYFDKYVFHHGSSEDSNMHGEDASTNDNGEATAPRIQLYKFDRDTLINSKRQHDGAAALASTIDFSEQYIGVWQQNALACGSYARSRMPPMQMPQREFHGERVLHNNAKDAMVSEGRRFILCLSDAALYFIIDDDMSPQKTDDGSGRIFPSRIPPNSTFSDAFWPHAVIRHPLDCLRGITIGFQFQRLILKFCVGNASSSFEYAYVILTSNKLQTVSLLQKLQSLLPSATNDLTGMGALIDNDDKAFLDGLGAPNEVVMHYQILHQIWKQGDRGASRRAFVLTDARVYLLDETFMGDGTKQADAQDKRKKLGDVSLSIIDSAKLDKIIEVRAANEDPRKITLVILQSKLKRSHRWRLVCNDREGAERLIDDVRKALAMRAKTMA